MRKEINRLKAEFCAKSCNEKLARSLVSAMAVQLDPTINELSDIVTAVSEAVTNSIIHGYGKNGKKKEIVGKAKYPDPQKHPGKLAVSFFLWFYSDYYVMYVDKDYKHVIIGSSSDKYLWIMSRTPSVSDAEFDTLLQIVKSRGYDISNLIIDRQ